MTYGPALPVTDSCRPETWSSSCPAAMAVLVARFKTITLNGEVRDGPSTGDSSAMEVITVGYIGPEDDTSVDTTAASGGLGMRDRETVKINCAVAVLTGMEDIPWVRMRAFALFDECGRRIKADVSLDRTVMLARIESWVLREDMTPGGAFARIRFTVGADAFTPTGRA